MKLHVPGWEGSVGPGPGYSKPHVYARDTHSGAGNCVCGDPVGAWLHVQAAPGVPVPAALRPPGRVPFACNECGRLSYHPEDKRQAFCGNCHAWTGDLLADALPNDAEPVAVVPPQGLASLVRILDVPPGTDLDTLMATDPAAVVRAVSEHAVDAAREALAAARAHGQTLPRQTIELALAGARVDGGWGLDWHTGGAIHRARIASSYGEVHDPITLIVSACGLTEPWDRPTPRVRAHGPSTAWPGVDDCPACTPSVEG